RADAVRREGVAEVRVVEHNEIVSLAQLVDGRRFESLERLRLPADGVAAAQLARCLLERLTPARVIPGEAHVIRHAWFSAIAPSALSCSIVAGAMPSSVRISVVCSPTSGAPRSMRAGVAWNRYGKPGVLIRPSVGWSYSTKVPLWATCGSFTSSS